MLGKRIEEAGVAHTMFVAFQGLALAANLLLVVLFVVITGIASMAAAQLQEAGFAAIESLWSAVASAGTAAALLYGLRLIYLRHAATRKFWTIYLVATILLYGGFVLIGHSGCSSTVPMVVNLGWLVYWASSKRVEALYP